MKKIIDKEKGSAIILAILVLAFFMALSMNMFFMAQRKSERAGVKAKGVRVLSNIDGGASIGYYELSRASNFVTNGVARKTGTTYAAVSVTISALSTTSPTAVFNGMVMEKYQQYFGGFVDTTTQAVVGGFVDTTTTTAIVKPERTLESDSAMWFRQNGLEDDGVTPKYESATTRINELWTTSRQTELKDDIPSIGGFVIARNGATSRKLTLNGTDKEQIPIGTDLKNSKIVVTYVKTLNIPEGNLTYSIECTREVEYDENAAVKSDDLTEIIVLFQ